MTETLIVAKHKLLDAIEAELVYHFGIDIGNYEARSIGLDVIRRLQGPVQNHGHVRRAKRFRQPETMAS